MASTTALSMTSPVATIDRTAVATDESSSVAIQLRRLTKRFGSVEAVRSVDLTIERGEIFGLIGPDGAGKTSVFQILGGVMAATSGEATILDRPARDARAY